MTQRAFTGLLILAAVLASIAYLWLPWEPDSESLKLGLDLQGGLRVVLQAEIDEPVLEDLQTARNIIENRVNEFGVAEPLVQTSGDNRIVVELPGLTSEDQDRALDLIGQQAQLEFALVRQGSNAMATQQLTLDDLEETTFTGEIIRTASADLNRTPGTAMGPIVLFEILREYANDFGSFTGTNTGRRMAIVLDGSIITAPTLQSRISDSGQITGIGDIDEATDIALVLRSGSLPFDLNVEEVRAIGPTLGQDSVRSGTTAALIGGAAVVLMILAFYGPLFGVVLSIGIGVALLFVFGVLAGLGAALTLPGLAGLVLTIGAAVDGNVISFERIKEELREGRGLRLAMKRGFGNSLSAIIDANATTLLAAGTLYQYTSGPVRGFAITLAIGIVAAVFVNTVIVPWMLDLLSLRISKPRLPKGFYAKGIQFRFVKRAPIVMGISAVLALGAIGVVMVKGLPLSTDFTGGSSVLLQTEEPLEIANVRSAIAGLDFGGITGQGATVVAVMDDTIRGHLVNVRVGLTGDSDVADQFPSALAEAVDAQVLQADFVGPAVGADLRQAAVLAVLVAIALILGYVSWRFWPTWIVAVAAVAAAVHDVGITLGAIDLMGAQFSIPVLAAMLFVVGYSLNDSIIIADRIRENLRKERGRKYDEIVDLSVNQTLSRTVMTSSTTLLPVVALLLFGGSVLRDFSLTLLIGIGVGTYSSIFILAPLVVWFKLRQREVMVRTAKRTA
ncbi:MAG: protein translocase subunit SecD [Trueperaceae bacterium]